MNGHQDRVTGLFAHHGGKLLLSSSPWVGDTFLWNVESDFRTTKHLLQIDNCDHAIFTHSQDNILSTHESMAKVSGTHCLVFTCSAAVNTFTQYLQCCSEHLYTILCNQFTEIQNSFGKIVKLKSFTIILKIYISTARFLNKEAHFFKQKFTTRNLIK